MKMEMNNEDKTRAAMMLLFALMSGARVEVVHKNHEDMTPEDCATCPAKDICPDCKKKEVVDDSMNAEDKAALRRMGIKA